MEPQPYSFASERQVRKLMEYFNKDPDSFTSEKMAKVSKAGNGLLTWVKAMIQYHEVAKGVEPKRKLVAELQQKQDEAERNLAKTRVQHPRFEFCNTLCFHALSVC